MRELSIFIDESGDVGSCSDYYLIALVFHNQRDEIAFDVGRYRGALKDSGLVEHTFHFTPVVRGHDQFGALGLEYRKSFFARFRLFVEKAPFRYHPFVYRKSRFPSVYHLAEQIERDLIAFLNERLPFFQSFARVKIYYDNGQLIVKHAVHRAIHMCLSSNAAVYRNAMPKDYYMSQVADYVCGIELAALRYERHAESPTDHRFFGDRRSFTKNYLKKIRRKLL